MILPNKKIPKVKGVISFIKIFSISLFSIPDKFAAKIAAPEAIASPGLIFVYGSSLK